MIFRLLILILQRNGIRVKTETRQLNLLHMEVLSVCGGYAQNVQPNGRLHQKKEVLAKEIALSVLKKQYEKMQSE